MTNKFEKQISFIITRFKLPHENLKSSVERLCNLLNISMKDKFYTSEPVCENVPHKSFYSDFQNIDRFYDKLKMYQRSYRKYGSSKVIDTYAEKHNKKPLFIFKDDIDMSTKRFVAYKQSELEYIEDKTLNTQGYFLETYIIADLNANKWICPCCKAKGSLVLCIESDDIIESFRDCICLKCNSYFEIKTKTTNFFTNKYYSKNTIYGGDYVSIDILLKKKKHNVYLILYNRDNGDVYCGKIINCYIRENEKYLYSIQEGIDMGYPSSTLKIDDFKYQTTISPANDYITEEKSNQLASIVINKFKSETPTK